MELLLQLKQNAMPKKLMIEMYSMWSESKIWEEGKLVGSCQLIYLL